jgi:hypothetical protein
MAAEPPVSSPATSAAVSAIWLARAGHGLAVSWPTGIGAVGSQNVLRDVQQQPGTIGYLELSYARQAALSVASIQNQVGEFVVPGPAGAALAINAFAEALAQDLRAPAVNPSASAKGAYPISGLTYVLIPRDDRTVGEQRRLEISPRTHSLKAKTRQKNSHIPSCPPRSSSHFAGRRCNRANTRDCGAQGFGTAVYCCNT